MAKKLKHHLKHEDKIKEISEEDFENADKILKAMLKVPPPKNWKEEKERRKK